ncbi:MAG: SIMPL domain-containing protein, partial [Planctomycetes bacterium]|nr:SIMPL domain-containing protein [Planctomycetota bacterium]
SGGVPAGWGGEGLPPATVRYEFSDPDAALEKAWDAAVENARKRAIAIATRFGRQVTEVVKIEDLSGAQEDSDGEPLPAGAGGAGAEAMRTSGAAELRADVRVTFRMK